MLSSKHFSVLKAQRAIAPDPSAEDLLEQAAGEVLHPVRQLALQLVRQVRGPRELLDLTYRVKNTLK